MNIGLVCSYNIYWGVNVNKAWHFTKIVWLLHNISGEKTGQVKWRNIVCRTLVPVSNAIKKLDYKYQILNGKYQDGIHLLL